MPKYDDEFQNVKKGVPTENSTQKASINFVVLFIVGGIIFAIGILLLQDTIISQGTELVKNGFVPQQIIINGIFALLVGSIQAWVFKEKIKSRGYYFIGFSLLGRGVAGLIGGLLMNSGLNEPFVIGLINGAIAGGISSSFQNKVMENNRYSTNWLIYSSVSWTIIFAITWTIGWQTTNALELATAGGFLIIASGVSLAIFLNNTPQIEFS